MKKCLPKKLTWFAIVIWIFPLIVSAKETTNSQEESVFVVGGTQKELTPFPNDEGTRKIIKQTEIEHEARLLEKQGYFDKAIVKYQEAMDATLLNTERDKSGGMVGIMRIHQKQGELDLALQDLEEWRKLHVSQPPGQLYVDTKSELEALIKMRDTNSNEPIYAHIEHLKKKYKKQLPPNEYIFSFSNIIASAIIRLYDYIGDADAGITFVDGVLSYKKLYPREHAAYLKVKEAFLKDKAEGTKGRATQVIIQSDYFPW